MMGAVMRNELIQICTGMLGSVGFAIIFHVQKEKLTAVAAGGALSWIVYLAVLERYGDKTGALFISAVIVTVLAEILARIMKTPATTLLVPMLVPLIPGNDLYYTTSYLVNGKMEECVSSLDSLVKSAGAIAFGIMSITCLFQVIAVRKKFSENR